MTNKSTKILFLDRDGVLNRERGDYVTSTEELILNTGSVSFLQTAMQHQYKLIVITNQGGIAKNLYSKETLQSIHSKLQALLKELEIVVDAFYYCPHHPIQGKCLCRKPDSLLLEKALHRYQAQASDCLFIGDKNRDIEAGEKAGIKSILVEENSDLTYLIPFLV